jgi:4-aminobutyrate aminotransferase-like enzyme
MIMLKGENTTIFPTKNFALSVTETIRSLGMAFIADGVANGYYG